MAIGWMYVVVMMAAAEAASPDGTWLGALVTLVLYGILPLSIVLYLIGTPRRRARRAAAAASAAALDPDRGGHPPGDPVAPVRKEP